MAVESPDLFDLERIKEIREEDITLPPHAQTRGSQGCIDRGNTARARDLLLEIKKQDKEYEEFDAVTEAIIRKKGQENAADRLKELDNKLETVHRLVARFNQALSKVPSSVLEKVKKTEDKEVPPKLDFLAKVKPMCNEMMTPAVTAAPIMPPPPIVPVKRVPSSSRKKQFTKKFIPDHYSTNKKSCDFDAALPREKCLEFFELIDTWNNEDDLYDWYHDCTYTTSSICHRTLLNMWKRWHRQKAGENTGDLNKGCCYYKHPLMWASLNEAWVEFCELREGKK